jgi:hypothetical protein
MRNTLRFISRVLSVFALVVLAASQAAAAQLALAWDPNTEPDIAGYIVEWGVGTSYTNTVDVGKVTTWTLTNAVEGTTYSFRVVAYNTAGERSDPSTAVTGSVTAVPTEPVPAPTPTPTPSPSPAPGLPTFSIDRTSLNFGVVRSGSAVSQKTPAQTLVITQHGGGTMNWTVAASQPWLQASAAAGTGSGAFTLSINNAALPASGNADATVTVSSTNSSTAAQVVTVRMTQMSAGSTAAPSGAFDTPTNGAINVVGAIPVTGWAIDDVVVQRVEIWRDGVTGEPVAANGKVFVGNAVFVAGARPDVESLAADKPLNYRAGWGYLLLTNGLPPATGGTAAGGNGTYTLHAYAVDSEGHQSFLGSKRITAANSSATKPFGTIDTPAQGDTIGGTNYVSFGWALSPTSTIPTNGSTIDVYIDGVNMGHPVYNNTRSDIASAFPGYANSNGAIGYFAFDTSKLTNGVHTIGWLATDAAGNAEGLGSRFFTVFNGTTAASLAAVEASTVGTSGAMGSQVGRPAEALAQLPVANQVVEVRRAFTPENALTVAVPEYSGRIALKVTELEQVELRLANEFAAPAGAAAAYEGYLVVGSELRPLPSGSAFDAAQGVFTWQPGAGFIGGYDFVFVRTEASGLQSKVPVRVQIAPKFEGKATTAQAVRR